MTRLGRVGRGGFDQPMAAEPFARHAWLSACDCDGSDKRAHRTDCGIYGLCEPGQRAWHNRVLGAALRARDAGDCGH